MTCWAIAKGALEAGHRVTVVSLAYPRDSFFNTPERQAAVLDLGADLIMVGVTAPHEPSTQRSAFSSHKISLGLRRLIQTDIGSFLPTVNLVPRMKATIERIAPDALFVYHWDSLATIQGLNLAPRMAGVGDPWHMPNLRRWQQSTPRPTPSYLHWTLRTFKDLLCLPKCMVSLLNGCEASGCFQAHAASWLRQKGAAHCTYLRSPIVDTCGPRWRSLREAVPRGSRPKILLGPSNLAGTSTRAGIRLFAKEILPRLERELGPEGFKVHVVGEGEPPPELAKLLPRPSVKLCGRIEPADSEFLSADIQLVPTPFVLGIRLRIIVGFSFGCCVVAHTNETLNLPEMIHEENALLASDGPGLAETIIRAARDPKLRERLGVNARRTYERYFAPEVAAAPIVAELERLAWERRRQLN